VGGGREGEGGWGNESESESERERERERAGARESGSARERERERAGARESGSAGARETGSARERARARGTGGKRERESVRCGSMLWKVGVRWCFRIHALSHTFLTHHTHAGVEGWHLQLDSTAVLLVQPDGWLFYFYFAWFRPLLNKLRFPIREGGKPTHLPPPLLLLPSPPPSLPLPPHNPREGGLVRRGRSR
jgi:hypothetical protein